MTKLTSHYGIILNYGEPLAIIRNLTLPYPNSCKKIPPMLTLARTVPFFGAGIGIPNFLSSIIDLMHTITAFLFYKTVPTPCISASRFAIGQGGLA